MRTENALFLLADHQTRILFELAATRDLLASPPGETRGELARVRWTLIRLLRAYQLFKHTEIFDPVIAQGDIVLAATARCLKANCLAAGDHYAAHVARWSARDVAAQWEQYRAAARGIIDDLSGHLARERREVEHLLAGSSRTRRLASPRP